MDFETILPEIGDFGRLQKLLFALLCFPICFTLPFTFMTQLFQTLQPTHWCKIPELLSSDLDLSAEERKQISVPQEYHDESFGYSKCKVYDLNYSRVSEILLSNTLPEFSLSSLVSALNASGNVSSLQTRTCQNGWEYDFENFSPTASSDWDWVCDNDWRPYLCLAVFFVGSSVGCLAFGFMSDRYGRVPTVLIVNALACVASIGSGFTTGYVSFISLRFLAGMTFDMSHIALYILAIEYTAASKRTMVANLSLALFFTGGSVILPWLAYFLPNWRILSIVTGVPFIIILGFFRVLPESSRWLAARGRINDAIKQLENIARFNKKTLREDFSEDILRKYHEINNMGAPKRYTLLHVFKQKRLRIRAIVLTLSWTMVMFCYDGLVRNTENLGYDVYISSTLGNLTELPAALIPILFMDRFGRKIVCCCSFLLGAFFCLLVLTIPLDYISAYVILATLGRMEITVLMNALTQFGTEIFPTVVRSQVLSLAHFVGFIGSMLSPFVVYMGHINRRIPLVVFGCASLFAAVITFVLPETLNENLPDTLEEGEKFGANQPWFYFPKYKKIGKKEKEMETFTNGKEKVDDSAINQNDLDIPYHKSSESLSAVNELNGGYKMAVNCLNGKRSSAISESDNEQLKSNEMNESISMPDIVIKSSSTINSTESNEKVIETTTDIPA